MWVGAETPLYQPSDGTHLSPQFCLVLITDEMGIACKVPNTVPGALPLPSDIFSCGHDSEAFSKGQEVSGFYPSGPSSAKSNRSSSCL